MTVPGALAVMAEVGKRFGEEVMVGAGTVLDAETARLCILEGARFIVSPVLDRGVFPGALTPTEVLAAWQAGGDAIKVFPCDAVGGAKYLRALKAPLPQIEVIPTGGVTLATAADFIRAGAKALGVGSDLVDMKSVRAGQPEKVLEAASAYINVVSEARRAAASI